MECRMCSCTPFVSFISLVLLKLPEGQAIEVLDSSRVFHCGCGREGDRSSRLLSLNLHHYRPFAKPPIHLSAAQDHRDRFDRVLSIVNRSLRAVTSTSRTQSAVGQMETNEITAQSLSGGYISRRAHPSLLMASRGPLCRSCSSCD